MTPPLPRPRLRPEDLGSAGTAGDQYRAGGHEHDYRQEHEPGRRASCRECEREAAR